MNLRRRKREKRFSHSFSLKKELGMRERKTEKGTEEDAVLMKERAKSRIDKKRRNEKGRRDLSLLQERAKEGETKKELG